MVKNTFSFCQPLILVHARIQDGVQMNIVNIVACAVQNFKDYIGNGFGNILFCLKEMKRFVKVVIYEVSLFLNHFGVSFYYDVEEFVWARDVTFFDDDVILKEYVHLQIIGEELHKSILVLGVEEMGQADGLFGVQGLDEAALGLAY